MSPSRVAASGFVLLALSVGACGKVRDSTDQVQFPPGTSDTGGSSSTEDDGGGLGGSSTSGAGGSAANGNTNGSGASGTAGSGAVTFGTGGIGSGGVSGSGGSSETGSSTGSGGTQDIPPDILNKPTVWVGEVESIVSYPTIEIHTGTEKVTLVLDAITNAVTGTVSFGEGPQPAPDPRLIYPNWTEGAFPNESDNWLYWPFPGFPYTILSSELIGNRLSLNFAPVEVWAALCATLPPGTNVQYHCECSATECHGIEQPIQRLELVVTGNTMAGEMTRSACSCPISVPSIRLTRIQ